MTKYPVVIPSKGRAGRTPSVNLGWDRPVHVVVEPQDAEAYRACGLNPVILPENDQGLGYALNAIQRTFGPAWILDDDISSVMKFGERITGEEALRHMEEFIDEDILMISPAFHFHPSYGPPKWDRHPTVWRFVNRSKVLYDPRHTVRENLPFIFRNWRSHPRFRTLIIQEVTFRCSKQAGNAGGCEKFYEREDDVRLAEESVQEFPDWLELRYNRSDVRFRVNWRQVDKDLKEMRSKL